MITIGFEKSWIGGGLIVGLALGNIEIFGKQSQLFPVYIF